MPAKKTDTTAETNKKQDCDCEALQSEIKRYTQQLKELDGYCQQKDARIAELEEQLAKCGDNAKVVRELDHAVNKADRLDEVNRTLAESNERLVKENAELSNAVRAFAEAVEKVKRAAPLRSSNEPAAAGRTSVFKHKRPPKFLNGTINPEWKAAQ